MELFAGFVGVKYFEDDRGFFTEIWKKSDPHYPHIKQCNLSKSSKHTVRGMHYNVVKPQAKLVRVVRGSLIDVVIDLREGSPDYLEVQAFTLSDPGEALYIPEGYAHGFQTLEDNTLMLYGCSEEYHPDGDRGISPLDESFNFPWLGSDEKYILSTKDKTWRTFDRDCKEFKYDSTVGCVLTMGYEK